ncbi:MAG: hypothetical protein EOO73_31095 [Myxococcales bacterium]|nr:MAG: hypothetical protein EOO73_31095 [Myxococcales bacterium]
MKSVAWLSVLGLAGFTVFQACGSKDDKRKTESEEGGAAGQGHMAGGAPTAPGAAGSAGAAGESAVSDGVAGEGGHEGVAGQGGAAASAGSANASGEAGAGAGGAEGGAGGGGDGGATTEVSCERATTCTNDLSGLGLADFSIAFSIQTTATVGSGILSQRAICMHSQFWDIRLRGGGTSISVELDDAVNYTDLTAPMVINDGGAHEVRVCRKSGHVYVFADGELVTDAEDAAEFTTLPPLATKTTLCTSLDGTIALDGTVADVCIGAL